MHQEFINQPIRNVQAVPLKPPPRWKSKLQGHLEINNKYAGHEKIKMDIDIKIKML